MWPKETPRRCCSPQHCLFLRLLCSTSQKCPCPSECRQWPKFRKSCFVRPMVHSTHLSKNCCILISLEYLPLQSWLESHVSSDNDSYTSLHVCTRPTLWTASLQVDHQLETCISSSLVHLQQKASKSSSIAGGGKKVIWVWFRSFWSNMSAIVVVFVIFINQCEWSSYKQYSCCSQLCYL